MLVPVNIAKKDEKARLIWVNPEAIDFVEPFYSSDDKDLPQFWSIFIRGHDYGEGVPAVYQLSEYEALIRAVNKPKGELKQMQMGGLPFMG